MNDQSEAAKAVAEWLDETEGFSLRRERLHADLEASPSNVLAWLETAFTLGIEAARERTEANSELESWIRERRAEAEKARNFPVNTCPASRHLQMMADALADSGRYPMAEEEPSHVAGSLYAVLASLWEARTRIVELEGLPE